MKRLLSLLTAAALVLSLVPAGALAAETGACEHHIQHDANCGYSEAVPESPCTHVHTQECYSSATQCVHAHTEQCYSDGVLPAEGEEKTADACAHVCSAETGCVTTALDCKHQHDETCGYAPATAGTPCTFVCEICSAAANEPAKCTCESKCSEGLVNGECPVCTAAPGSCTGKEPEPPAPVCNCTAKCAEGAASGECPVCGAEGADLSACQGKEPEQPQVITITEWSWVVTADTPKLADGKLYLPSAITEANLAGITDTLPKNIEANGQSIPVSWTYDWDAQTFTAALPEGYVLAEGAALLTVAVVVKDASPLPVTDTGLTIGGQAISSGDYWTTDSNGTLSKYDGSGQPQDHYIHFDGSTLTLHNATITGGIEYSGSSLTIDLAGTNKVSYDDNAISLLATETASLTIQGTGSLAVASTNQGYGIHLLSGDGTGAILTVDTCTLTVDGNPGIYFSSNGGSVSASLTVNGSALVRSDGGIDANGTTAMDTISGTGIVFSGNKGTVYGHATLSGSLTLEKGETLTIPSSASLTVPSSVTLTNKGTITGSGAITNNGTIVNSGTLPSGVSGTVYQSPVITTTTLSSGKVGAPYNAIFTADGTITWSITGGSLPAGLSLSEQGELSGTPGSAGTFNFTVTATNDYGSQDKQFSLSIVRADVTGITLTPASQEFFVGESTTITAKLTPNGAAGATVTWSSDNPDFTVTPDPTNSTQATVTASAPGKATITAEADTVTQTCEITAVQSVYQIAASPADLSFDSFPSGNSLPDAQTITITNNGNRTVTLTQPTAANFAVGKLSRTELAPMETATFTLQPKAGLDPGDYSETISITGSQNATAAVLAKFTVIPDLSSAKVTLGAALTYTGKDQTQTVKSVTLGGKTLTEDTDYTVTNNTGKDAGTYTLTITGKGNYTGTLKVSFPIAKAPLTITGVDVQSKTYDGTTAATVTGVSFKGLVNGEALAMGVDYTATADFADASAGTGKSLTGKVTLLSSTVGKNYTLNGGSFTTSGDISAAASKLSFKVDRTKPVKGQYITFSVTPQIKGDNRSFLQRVLGINAPKVEFWANGTTKLGEVKVEEGKTSTFAYDTDKGGLKLGKNTITAEFTGDGNLKGCTESVVVYLHDSTTSAPTGDESNIQTWTAVLVVSAVALVGLGVGAVIYRKKKK